MVSVRHGGERSGGWAGRKVRHLAVACVDGSAAGVRPVAFAIDLLWFRDARCGFGVFSRCCLVRAQAGLPRLLCPEPPFLPPQHVVALLVLSTLSAVPLKSPLCPMLYPEPPMVAWQHAPARSSVLALAVGLVRCWCESGVADGPLWPKSTGRDVFAVLAVVSWCFRGGRSSALLCGWCAQSGPSS